MHILRYLVLLTVFFGLAYVVYQYMGEEDVQPTKASASFAQKPEVFVQLGHSSEVKAVAFSPDGKQALSGSWDETLKLWDVETGREIRTIPGHTSIVYAVAFSPNGKRALSGSGDNTLKLWDVETGQEIRTFTGHTDSVTAVAFSPDGKWVLSGSTDKTLKLWNVETGREIRTFTGHTLPVSAVAFSPDGKRALSGSSDKTLKLWNVRTGHEIRTFTGHTEYVYAVTFSPDGKRALSGSHDKTLKLWNVRTGHEIRTFTGHTESVYAVAFSPDGKQALSGAGIGMLKLWDVKTAREIRTWTRDTYSSVYAVAFSPDGKLALSGYGDKTLNLWNIKTGHEIYTLSGHTSLAYNVAFSPDSKRALSVSSDKTLNLWNVETGYKIRTLAGHTQFVNAAAFSPDGKRVLSVSRDNTIKLWDIDTDREIRTLTGHTSFVSAIAFSPDGKLALSGSHDKTLKLWEIETGREIHTLTGHLSGVYAIAFSPDGKQALSGSHDKTLKLWEVETGREIHTLTGHLSRVYAIAFSPDGKLALSGSGDRTLKLWDVETGSEIRTLIGHTDWITTVAFSSDGKRALSGSCSTLNKRKDNTLKLWDVETGNEILSLTRNTEWFLAIAFSPDGRLVLSGNRDGKTSLWNIETGKVAIQMVDFDDGEWVTITPEGYYTASLNGAKYLNVRVGNEVYGIDQYEAIYHRPDIVKLAIKLGDSQQAVAQLTRNAPPIQIAQVQPPKIWFVAPQQGHETDRSTITVNIETKEFVDSAESVTFKVNGRPVGREKGKRDRAKVAGVKTQSYHRQVPLQIGENQIEVEVRGKAGAVQRTSILVIRKGKVVKLPDLYFLGIGVATHPILSLQYPAKDVTKLAETFKQQRGRAYKQVFIKTLTDQQATRINLIQAITTFFKDVKQGDIAIVYVSGHGMNTSMGYHFLTYDANPDSLEATGASWQTFDAIYDLPSHVFLWVDTCRAGNIVGNTDWKARAQEARPDIFLRDANNRGVIVFASSSGSDVSQEDKRWEHSAFAKALLDGLNGEAADKKGRVPFDMLRRHVLESVEEMTDGLQKPTIPRITGTGAFLDLVLARR